MFGRNKGESSQQMVWSGAHGGLMGGMEPRLAITFPWPIPAGTSHYPEACSLSINDKKLYTGLHTHIHTFLRAFLF